MSRQEVRGSHVGWGAAKEVIGLLLHQGDNNEAYIPQDMRYCVLYTMACVCGTFCLCECLHVCIALSSCDVFPAGYKLQLSDSDRHSTVCHLLLRQMWV